MLKRSAYSLSGEMLLEGMGGVREQLTEKQEPLRMSEDSIAS